MNKLTRLAVTGLALGAIVVTSGCVDSAKSDRSVPTAPAASVSDDVVQSAVPTDTAIMPTRGDLGINWIQAPRYGSDGRSIYYVVTWGTEDTGEVCGQDVVYARSINAPPRIVKSNDKDIPREVRDAFSLEEDMSILLEVGPSPDGRYTAREVDQAFPEKPTGINVTDTRTGKKRCVRIPMKGSISDSAWLDDETIVVGWSPINRAPACLITLNVVSGSISTVYSCADTPGHSMSINKVMVDQEDKYFLFLVDDFDDSAVSSTGRLYKCDFSARPTVSPLGFECSDFDFNAELDRVLLLDAPLIVEKTVPGK